MDDKNENKKFRMPQLVTDGRKQLFDMLIKSGSNRAHAYQKAYGLDYESAKKLADQDTFESLVSYGVPIEQARAIVYKTDEKKKGRRR